MWISSQDEQEILSHASPLLPTPTPLPLICFQPPPHPLLLKRSVRVKLHSPQKQKHCDPRAEEKQRSWREEDGASAIRLKTIVFVLLIVCNPTQDAQARVLKMCIVKQRLRVLNTSLLVTVSVSPFSGAMRVFQTSGSNTKKDQDAKRVKKVRTKRVNRGQVEKKKDGKKKEGRNHGRREDWR